MKPAKVVAGHEPERTNEFLQALATAISSKVKCNIEARIFSTTLVCLNIGYAFGISLCTDLLSHS